MESYNKTNTMERLTGIYNGFCSKNKTISPRMIYSILGQDQAPGVTYNKVHLAKLSGMNYSKWNFIPDNFKAQNLSADRVSLDDAYGDGDYFGMILNSQIVSDERIIMNVDTQQNALLFVSDLINAGFNFISSIKFYAKSPRVSQQNLKCDKVVAYYQKGAGDNNNRTALLARIQQIKSARAINVVDRLNAFYHKELSGIGYTIEMGGDSFTTRIARRIEGILNTSATSLRDVKFDGTATDRSAFADQVFAQITQLIENKFS